MFNLLLTLSVLLAATMAQAQVTLWVWQPSPQHARMILPRVANETPEQSLTRYLKSVNAVTDLRDLFSGPLSMERGQITPLAESPDLRALILANQAKDMSENPLRITNVTDLLKSKGAQDVLILPVAADAGLSQVQMSEFREKVAVTADLVLALGGEDIDPKILRQPLRYSEGKHPSRDQSEALLLRTVLNKRHAFVAGICRGHQMIVSLLSRRYRLVQDLKEELQAEGHRSGTHSMRLLNESFMSEIQPLLPLGEINTLHHEGFADLPEEGPIDVVATDAHGVVEATAFQNGLGLTVQFHPELMVRSVAEKFAEILMRGARQARSWRNTKSRAGFCAALFNR